MRVTWLTMDKGIHRMGRCGWISLCFVSLFSLLFFSTGRVPGLSPTAKELLEDDSAMKEEHVARELQSRLDAGDHPAVFKLWQRVRLRQRPGHQLGSRQLGKVQSKYSTN